LKNLVILLFKIIKLSFKTRQSLILETLLLRQQIRGHAYRTEKSLAKSHLRKGDRNNSPGMFEPYDNSQ